MANSDIKQSIYWKRAFLTNFEAQFGRWYTKINLESHGNFTCNFLKGGKKVGWMNRSKFKFKKTWIGHLLERANSSKIRINLLIRFNRFYNCSIYIDLMLVTCKAWLIRLLYWPQWLAKWELSVSSRIRSSEFLFSKDCIPLRITILRFTVRHLTTFWKTLILEPMTCFKRNTSVLRFSLSNGFTRSLVVGWISKRL